MNIVNHRLEHGFIFMTAEFEEVPAVEFRATIVEEDEIILMYSDKKKLYNLVLRPIRK